MGGKQERSYTRTEEPEGFLNQNTRGTTGAKETESSKQERRPKRVYEGVYFKHTLGR